jgi:hypothetical protein
VENKALTRKDFILLTFTLIGSTAVAGSACDDEDNTTGAGGTGGGGTGRGGTTGSAGRGGSGGTTGSAGSGGTTGTAGSGGTTGAAGSGNVSACNAGQQPDTTGHTHTLTVAASILSATSTQTLNTSLADGHVHGVNLTTANLQTLAGGGSITVMSEISSSHTHMYMVTCS